MYFIDLAISSPRNVKFVKRVNWCEFIFLGKISLTHRDRAWYTSTPNEIRLSKNENAFFSPQLLDSV